MSFPHRSIIRCRSGLLRVPINEITTRPLRLCYAFRADPHLQAVWFRRQSVCWSIRQQHQVSSSQLFPHFPPQQHFTLSEEHNVIPRHKDRPCWRIGTRRQIAADSLRRLCVRQPFRSGCYSHGENSDWDKWTSDLLESSSRELNNCLL